MGLFRKTRSQPSFRALYLTPPEVFFPVSNMSRDVRRFFGDIHEMPDRIPLVFNPKILLPLVALLNFFWNAFSSLGPRHAFFPIRAAVQAHEGLVITCNLSFTLCWFVAEADIFFHGLSRYRVFS